MTDKKLTDKKLTDKKKTKKNIERFWKCNSSLELEFFDSKLPEETTPNQFFAFRFFENTKLFHFVAQNPI